MIAFMGEERVFPSGDNVLAAAAEASLSEIKHDVSWARRRGDGATWREFHLALEIFFVVDSAD